MVIWKVEGDNLHYFATKEQAQRFMTELDDDMRLRKVEIKNRDQLLRELKSAARYDSDRLP